MDNQEITSSPRKKLKMDPGPMDPLTNTQVPKDSYAGSGLEASSITNIAIDSHSMQLHREEDVGITEFVSPELPGFTGILKKRYTDFLVNEILPSGQVVHLDNYKAPKFGHKTDSVAQTEHKSSQTTDTNTSAVQDAVQSAEPIAIVNTETSLSSGAQEQALLAELTEKEPQTDEPANQVPAGSASATKEEPKPEAGVTNVVTEHTNGSSGNLNPNAVSSVSQWQTYANKPAGFQLTPGDSAIMTSFFDIDVVNQIIALFNRIINSPHRKPKEYGTVMSAAIKDRDLRTKIHGELRRIFLSRLESYTDDSGAMVISAAPERTQWDPQAGGGRNPGGRTDGGRQKQQKGKLGWKDLGGEYLHFSLYKENKDTMEVVSYLARSLKVNPRSFQFAGTKDRRGVTVQRVSVYRAFADKMIPIGRTLRNAKIGNYEYQPQGLELGELTGNEFLITLRDCHFENLKDSTGEDRLKAVSTLVETAAKHLSEKGYLNYYGLQRFGTFSTRTDTIGKQMLQGDFHGAVASILDFHPSSLAAAQDSTDETISHDDKARAFAIHSFQTTGKSYTALDILPRKFSAEANVIRHLSIKERANDYLGALHTIPRNLRLMYVHAYQSLIWNLAASHRWKHCGAKLLAGDLVLVDEHKDKGSGIEEPDQVDADGEVIVQPTAGDSATLEEERFVRARALSKEDITSGKYSVYDVVLPTPGFDILYPENVLKEFYETKMASELGGGLDPHNMRRPWKDISLSGSYRKLLAKPVSDISVEVHSYTRDDEQFVETDLDRMNKRNRPNDDPQAVNSTHKPQQDVMNTDVEKQDQESQEPRKPMEAVESADSKIAVVLKVQLGSSQYATMALRELMKLGGVRTYKPDFGGGR